MMGATPVFLVPKFVAGVVWNVSAGQSVTLGVLNSLDITWNTLPIPGSPVAAGVLAVVLFDVCETYSCAPPWAVLIAIGYRSLLSPSQTRMPRPHCFKLLTHWMRSARALALASAGSNMAAKIAIIAITTS